MHDLNQRRFKRLVFAWIAAFSLFSLPLNAQLTRGTISGTVTDSTNAVIAGGQVSIRNLETGIERTTTTNEVGIYRFPAIEPGSYSVEFKAQGFQDRKLDKVNLSTSQEIVLNETLSVGAVLTEVAVEATAVDIAKTNATISRTLDQRVVEDLPITAATRDVTRLALLAPTVTRAPGSTEFAANGQRARNNNFIIDGTDNNDLSVTLTSSRLIPEAVAEFQVQTTAYSAEFGRNSGAQVQVITRSGTNQFHGEGWEFYRGNWVEPVALANKRAGVNKTPRFVHNQGGASLGGPMIKDRTFFFGLFEVNRRREAADGRNATSTDIPTPAGYAALQSVPLGTGQSAQSRQAMLQSLSFLPEIHRQVSTYDNVRNQTLNGVPIQVGSIIIPLANPYDYWYSVGRVDHKITNNDAMSYRFYLDHRNEPDVTSNLRYGQKWSAAQLIFAQNHAVSYTRIFSPRLVNEFRTAYIRRFLDFPERDPKSSTITITGLTTLGGLANFPQGRISNIYQGQDVATLTTGRHGLKFGFDVRNNRLFSRSGFDSKGTWTFNNLQDFMNNRAFSLLQAVNEASFDARQWTHFYFFQDDLKATKNLTFNLGLRYEYSTVPLGLFGAANDPIAAAGVPRPARPDKNNWAPRFGFAYSPANSGGFIGRLLGSGQSSIRGGFGVAYDVLFYNILSVNASNYPRVLSSTTNQPATINLFPNLAPKIAAIPPFDPMLSFVNSPGDIENPTTNFWSLSIQRQFHTDYVFEIGYSGNRSYHQIRQGQLNPSILTPQQAATVVATQNANSIPGLPARRLNPAWGTRTTIEATAKGEYHAGYVKFDKRMTRGLLIGANYTFSANFSDNDESLNVTNLSDSSPQIPQDYFNYKKEWSRSAFDKPHRFVIHYVYEIPWFASGAANSPVLRQIFNGWQMAGFTEFESGQPFTIRTGVDNAGIGSATPGRPNYNPGGILVKDPATNDLRTFTIPINGTGIVTAPLGTNGLPLANSMSGGGNLGRNTFRGPGYNYWNFSLSKTFSITERINFQLRSDFINLWNHNNFRNPENRMSSPSFGANTATLISDSRTILFGGKLRF